LRIEPGTYRHSILSTVPVKQPKKNVNAMQFNSNMLAADLKDRTILISGDSSKTRNNPLKNSTFLQERCDVFVPICKDVAISTNQGRCCSHFIVKRYILSTLKALGNYLGTQQIHFYKRVNVLKNLSR
jgi:hypothetical protein